ncbi:hypothetical protein GQ44DRAFT_832148 [Phaeosphaeriaceae sp. PMI808]|nr:hypothetical protein GQ44DRAFT_832148 [Phaeosphaeriaceae sp. PMI808]
MRTLSIEGIEGIRHEPSPAEDKPLFDVDIMSRLPLTREQTRRSSAAKAVRATGGSLILDPISTLKPTPLLDPISLDSYSIASNKPSPSPLDNNSQSGGARNPVPLPNTPDKENSDDSAYTQETAKELPHSPRQSIPHSKGMEREKDGRGSDDESEVSHQDEQVDAA